MAKATTTTWTGADSTTWTDADNWTNGVPTSGETVVIGVDPNEPTFGSLTLSGDTVDLSGTLTGTVLDLTNKTTITGENATNFISTSDEFVISKGTSVTNVGLGGFGDLISVVDNGTINGSPMVNGDVSGSGNLNASNGEVLQFMTGDFLDTTGKVTLASGGQFITGSTNIDTPIIAMGGAGAATVLDTVPSEIRQISSVIQGFGPSDIIRLEDFFVTGITASGPVDPTLTISGLLNNNQATPTTISFALKGNFAKDTFSVVYGGGIGYSDILVNKV